MNILFQIFLSIFYGISSKLGKLHINPSGNRYPEGKKKKLIENIIVVPTEGKRKYVVRAAQVWGWQGEYTRS